MGSNMDSDNLSLLLIRIRFYLVSYGLKSLNISEYILSILNLKLIVSKSSIYEQSIEEIASKRALFLESANFHKAYAIDTFMFFIQILLVGFLLLISRRDKEELKTYHYFILSNTALLMCGMSNLSTLIPSLSKRLEITAGFFVISFLILAYVKVFEFRSKSILFLEFFIKLGMPIIILFLFMQVSYILEFSNVVILFPLPIGMFFYFDDISIKIALKQIVKFFL